MFVEFAGLEQLGGREGLIGVVDGFPRFERRVLRFDLAATSPITEVDDSAIDVDGPDHEVVLHGFFGKLEGRSAVLALDAVCKFQVRDLQRRCRCRT